MADVETLKLITKRFKEKGLIFSPSWLRNCVDFLTSSNVQCFNDKNLQAMCNEVFNQFLFADMCTMMASKGAQLPDNVNQLHNVVIEKDLILQVVGITDVASDPNDAGDEHLEAALNDTEEENDIKDAGLTEWEDMQNEYSKSSVKRTGNAPRMLVIVLTDGYTNVLAIEHRPIPSMKLETPSGCKLKITNPKLRRGLLILDESNIGVLGGLLDGGEVEYIKVGEKKEDNNQKEKGRKRKYILVEDGSQD